LIQLNNPEKIASMRRSAPQFLVALWVALSQSCSLADRPKVNATDCMDVGLVSSVDRSRIFVRNDEGSRAFDLNPGTIVNSARPLRRGDSVMVLCIMSSSGAAVATSVAANVTRLAGTVTAFDSHSIRLAGRGGAGEVDGRLTVILTDSTTFAQGSRKDISLGRDLEVTGYDLGHNRVQATGLNIWPK
jgi:hypothetical protein